jgi:hypothetical protein
MTRSSMAWSRGGLRSAPGSSAAPVTADSSSARASRLRPRSRSSRGRSPGSTQTSGSVPVVRVKPARSSAAALPVRSSTVISPPAGSWLAAAVVSIADQPAIVPPAISIRWTPSGRRTEYQRFCCSYASWRACQSFTWAACSACQANRRLSCASRARPIRARSSAILDRSARSPCHKAYPLTAATSAQQVTASPVRRAPSEPAAPSAASTRPSTTATANAAFSGRLIRLSSRRCAATQSGLSRSASGGVGRRGGGPGSGNAAAYCHPTWSWPGRGVVMRPPRPAAARRRGRPW